MSWSKITKRFGIVLNYEDLPEPALSQRAYIARRRKKEGGFAWGAVISGALGLVSGFLGDKRARKAKAAQDQQYAQMKAYLQKREKTNLAEQAKSEAKSRAFLDRQMGFMERAKETTRLREAKRDPFMDAAVTQGSLGAQSALQRRAQQASGLQAQRMGAPSLAKQAQATRGQGIMAGMSLRLQREKQLSELFQKQQAGVEKITGAGVQLTA